MTYPRWQALSGRRSPDFFSSQHTHCTGGPATRRKVFVALSTSTLTCQSYNVLIGELDGEFRNVSWREIYALSVHSSLISFLSNWGDKPYRQILWLGVNCSKNSKKEERTL